MNRPRVALINGTWTITYQPSDPKLSVTTVDAHPLDVAMRRARRLGWRLNGRGAL